MSEKAVEASVLVKDKKVLSDMGVKDIKQPFPNSQGDEKDIIELVRNGARFEDNFPRSLNHFYDPINDQGLLGANPKSPDWALEDQGEIDGQEFSYRNARQYFYDALTIPSRTERDKNFGKTFQTLGQVIHHIQDMAQPQHVRNDDHCDIWPCRLVPGLFSPSLYEKYTKGVGNLPFTGYGPVMFPTARHFWTDNGQGIAEFSNRNFVSAGTNYQLYNDNPVPGANYFEPIPSGFGPLVPIEQLFNEIGETTTLTGLVGFVENEVYDSRTGLQTTNKRSASLSIFDQDLNTYGVAVPYTDPITGQTWLTNRLFTLNRFNFQAAYPHLIPKAVGYSAGLIDYFFRGKLEVSLPNEGVYAVVDHKTVNEKDTQGFTQLKVKLKNTTLPINDVKQHMAGGKLIAVATFRRNVCYRSDLTGEFYYRAGTTLNGCTFSNYRTPEKEIVLSEPIADVSLSADSSASPKTFTFTFTKPIPINATDLYLQIVYRGPLGAEADAVVVTRVDLYEPTYFSFYNGSDYVLINGKFYTSAEIKAEIDANTVLGKIVIDNKIQYRPVAILDFRLDFGASTVVSMPSLNQKSYLRIAYLTDQPWTPVFLTADVRDVETGGLVYIYYYSFVKWAFSKVNQDNTASAVDRVRGTYYWDAFYFSYFYPKGSDLIAAGLPTLDPIGSTGFMPVTINFPP